MFLCFCCTIYSKAIKAGNKNFVSTIKKAPYTVVLFTSSKCIPCRSIISTMDDLSVKCNNKIGMVFTDVGSAPDIITKYRIEFTPQIVVFHSDILVKRYIGAWNVQSLTNLCEKLISIGITYLNQYHL